ncbi:MAG: protein kinase [Pyrinomonadaceae bacterium]
MLAANTLLQDRYRIVRQLGQGGMGTVYEAVDQRLSSIVAIKENFLTSPEARNSFAREASLLANLRHSSLPNVIDHFAEGDGQYLVMEFIPGDDLAQLLELRGRPFPAADVLRWGDEILKALVYLHNHNPPILHRDIKPSNLKLTPEGELFLLDFGLAKGAAGQMPTLLTSRSVKGYTPVYSPLEQIHGVGTDPRSDLYSLGATLYHLITSVVPVDAPARFTSIDDEQPDPLRPADEVNPKVPHAVAVILSAAMAMNRRQRPGSAKEMRELLREAGESLARPDATEASTREFPEKTANAPATTKPRQEPIAQFLPPTEPGTPVQIDAPVQINSTPRAAMPTITAVVPPLLNQTAQPSAEGYAAKPSPRIRLSPAIVVMLVLGLGLLLIFGSAVVAPGFLLWLKRGNGSPAATSTPELASVSNPQVTPVPTPTPSPTPEFVKVRLRLISEGASGCSVYKGETVTLTTKDRTFNAVTNGSGIAAFSNVPCGDTAKITARGIKLQFKDGFVSVSRSLKCLSDDIYLGSFGDTDGHVMSEKQANTCYK